MISIAPATTAFTVRVGHIGAMNAMPNSDKILEIARTELWKDGILADDFDIELIISIFNFL
uniref:Uncharacterized protein n=1 Tax=Parascaris equorum TaxID=6256 RepID=A0A914RIY8_PAREQ